jgi:LysR family hydrogen peroxide-inducible transcriptional activator
MTLTQLQYMIAVAEYGNFTIAAKKSNVTQPTLSMQVQKLEEELGVKIFNRNKKPIVLTRIGQKILAQSKKIIVESDRMRDTIDMEKGVVAGDFKLGIIPTIMPTILPIFLNDFLKKHKNVNLIIQELNTNTIIENLNAGKLDGGIVSTPLKNEKIIEYPLYYEPFVGYIPDNHRLSNLDYLSNDEIENEEILILEDGHCLRNQVLNFCSMTNERKKKNFKLKSGSFETLINLANEGLGITIIPFLNSKNINLKEKGKIKKFRTPSPGREVSLIFHKNELKLQIINAIKKIIDLNVRGKIIFDDIQIIGPTIS